MDKYDLINKYKCLRLRLYVLISSHPVRSSFRFLELTDDEAEYLKLRFGLDLIDYQSLNERFVIVPRSEPYSDNFKEVIRAFGGVYYGEEQQESEIPDDEPFG